MSNCYFLEVIASEALGRNNACIAVISMGSLFDNVEKASGDE